MNHTFILDGTTKQTISGSGIYFDKLKIYNTSPEGIDISTTVYVRGTLFNTDTPISNSSNIWLNGGSVDGGVWNYDLTLYGSVSYGNLHIKGDAYGYIYMTNPDDYLLIDGDLNFENNSTLTNGVLEVKGDILQGNSTYLTFIASNNHKTILSGDELQTVSITHTNSAFNVLEIKNYSDDGVVFTNIVKIGELVTNDCKVTIPLEVTAELTNIIEESVTLTEDSIIIGNMYLNAGTLDLNGFSLTVTGNVIHSGGTMNINGGTLNINGDYRIQSEKLNTYTSSTGILRMQNASDTVNIVGSYILQSTVQSYLTAGTMNIGGNIQQLNGHQYSLTSSGSHTIVLNGSSLQRISIYYPTYSVLRNLTIENSSESGVTFQTNVYVSGEFSDNENKLKSPNYLVISGGIYNPTEYKGNLTVTKGFTLGSDLTIKGNLTLNGGTLNLNGHKLTVTGNYTQSSGNFTLDGDVTIEGNAGITQGVLSLSGHKLTINGSLTNNTSKVYDSSYRRYSYYSGYIKMTNPEDYLFVGGNFTAITINNTQNYYTAGTLEVKGNFIQGFYPEYIINKYGFYASGTHRVILSGEALQTVRFDNTESKFCILEIINTSDDGVVFSTPVNYSRIITNDSKVSFYNNMRSGWTLSGDETIDTDLNLGSGVLNLNGHTLTINGSLNQYAGKVNINGGKLIINGDYLIQNLFETSNTVSSGILSMIKPADLVSVSGDFVMQSSVSHKYYLTAGTLEIGGDFIENSGGSTTDFYASGSHKVVLNGTGAQTVNLKNYYYCVINSLILQNTSSEGITFANITYVTNELINDNSILNSSEKIYITSSASLSGNEWKGNLTFASRADFPGVFVLEKPLTIDGTLSISGYFTSNKHLTVNGNLNFYGGNTFVNDGIYVKGNTYINSSSQGNEVFYLNSEMNVDGDVVIYYGILNVNGQTLNIGGDLSLGYRAETYSSYSNGYIKMTNTEDRVNVGGDFYMNTYVGSSGFLTNGILDIKGDFLQYTNDNASNGFYATGNHRTILSGDKLQNVVFDAAKSKFSILEIKNYSEDGILINNSINYNELITNGCKITYAGDERIGWKLTSNEIVDGDLYLTAGTLDLNGFTLTITGNLIQRGGTVFVNGGTLDIAGDFKIQKKTGESFDTSIGILKMVNSDDVVIVGGSFTTQSQESHEGYLTAGKMYVAGDFTQLSPSSSGGNRNPYYDHSFYPTGSHTVILNGTEAQNVSLYFSSYSRYRSNGEYDYSARFENLSIENTSNEGVNFSNALRVYGEISNRSSKFQNLSNLYFTPSTVVAGGIWADDLYINDNMTLGSDFEITGDLYINRDLNLNNHTLSVCGNVIHKSGTLTIGGGKLYIDGNYENSYSKNGSNGTVSMINISDYMLVGGNFYAQTNGNNYFKLTAGVLEICGNVDLRYYSSSYTNTLAANGSHKTILSGENVQTVFVLGSVSTFNILEITKDFETGYSFTNLRYNELIEAKPDTELPIIRSISVQKKYITGSTSVNVIASDNSSVKSITLQYSPDGEVWTDYTTVDNINRSSITKDIYFQNSINGTYFIRAVAADSKGNLSDVDISPYETVVVDKTIPSAPNSAVSSIVNGGIKISWKYDLQNEDVDYFRIYRKTAATSYVLYYDNCKNTSFTDNNFNTGITYTYKITAIDKAGNSSGDSNEVSEIVHYDRIPPTKPILTAGNVDQTSAVLSWKSSDNIGVSSYSLYRNNVLLKTITENTYTDTTLSPDTEYYYYVVASDASDNKSEKSNVLSVSTEKDNIAPTVSSMRITNSGKTVSVSVSASDENSVTKVYAEYSLDKSEWTALPTLTTNGKPVVSATFSIDTSVLKDGTWYIRAYAEDGSENISSASVSLIGEFTADNTAPAVPYSLISDTSNDTIKISWEYDEEADDTAYFKIYKKTGNGEYLLYKNNINYINWYDNYFEPGVTYSYKVKSVDRYGNESDYSSEVTAIINSDETAPEILSIYPATGFKFSADTGMSINCYDNLQLKKLTVTYKKTTDSEWLPLYEETLNTYHKVVDFNIDTTSFENGTYDFKAVLTDFYDNTSEVKTVTYDFSKGSLSNPELAAEGKGWQVALSWSMNNTENLTGYHIYKRSQNSVSFLKLASIKGTSYTDGQVTAGQKYFYKVEAVDEYGNVTSSNEIPAIPTHEDNISPQAVGGSDLIGVVEETLCFDGSKSADNHQIDKYVWDFGDGVSSIEKTVNHYYEKSGSYTATLTVTDSAGNSASDTVDVVIYGANYDSLEVQTLSDSGGKLGGVHIICDELFGEDNDIYSDSNGNYKIAAKSGTYTMYFYKEGYLPIERIINTSNISQITVNLTKQAIADGTITIRELTFDEIIAKGIDPTDPANRHVSEYVVEVEYDSQKRKLTIYRNAVGDLVTPDDKKSGTHETYKQDGDTLFTVDDNNLTFGDGWRFIPASDVGFTDEPSPYIAAMRISTEISWLKSFYQVDLIVFNNAGEGFDITNAKAKLNIPTGLSFASGSTAVKEIEIIESGKQATASWIIRGDIAGTYGNISADFTGTLSPIDEPINIKFKTDDKIVINAGKALSFDVVHDLWSPTNDVWQIDYTLTNISEKTVNDIKIDVFCDHIENAKLDVSRMEIFSEDNIYPVIIHTEDGVFNKDEAEWLFNPFTEDIRVTAFNLEPGKSIEFTVYVNKIPPIED